MKNQYIKFIEWNKESLNEAARIAESLGYRKYLDALALANEWKWLLMLEWDWIYYTTWFSEQLLQSYNYTLYKDLTNIQLQKPNKKKVHKYMVFVEDTKAPKKIHESFKLATKEAKRLTRLTWKKTYVCKLSAAFQAELKQINI